MSIKWDTGEWRNCFHMNPPSMPEVNTERKMEFLSKKQRRYDHMWGVVNPCNALCAAVFRRKADADKYKRDHASAYVVVGVIVTPIYTEYVPEAKP